MIFAYIDPGTGQALWGSGAAFAVMIVTALGVAAGFLRKTFRALKPWWKFIIIGLFIIFGLLTLVVLNMSSALTLKQKIVILGFDGLSPAIVEKMMTDGQLPNFAKLKEQGSYARLSTTNPAQSPVAWASFATGKNPGKTGIFDFIRRDPGTYGLDISITNFKGGAAQAPLKTRFFWDDLRPANIFYCPGTFPAQPTNGKMLSGMGTPDLLGTQGTFTFYTSAPEPADKKDTGGRVFHVRKAPQLFLNIIGPALKGREENINVPFTVNVGDKNLRIELQGREILLQEGQWSPWQKVTFKIGFLNKVSGIFRFYLAGLNPDLKLYISPLSIDPEAPLYNISYPSSSRAVSPYSQQLCKQLGRSFHTLGMPYDTWALNEKRLDAEAFLQSVDMVIADDRLILEHELKQLHSGLLFYYFGATDAVQHMFWPADGEPGNEKTIAHYYREMDTVLGNVMAQLSAGDYLLVLSDHGFGPFRRAVHVNAWLKENGYLILKDASAKTGAELFADVDWSKTKAYAAGFGGVYINQKGREAKGIVAPGPESESLKKELAQKLMLWRDEAGGQQLIKAVYPSDQIFKGPFAKDDPDLFIGFNLGYRASWQTAIGAAPDALIEDNQKKWDGDHLFDPALVPAVIFSNHKIAKSAPSIYDLAPTVLKIAGCDEKELKKRDFDGTPLW